MTPDQMKSYVLMVAHVLETAGTLLGRPAVAAAGAALAAFANSDQFAVVFATAANAVALLQQVIDWLKHNHPAGAAYLTAVE